MSAKPMTTEEMRRAAAGHPHEYRPSFKRAACSRCGRDRQHPSHGPKLPPLNCWCGAVVERPDLHDHIRSHGVFMCGLDPWKATDRSLAEVGAFIESLKAKRPTETRAAQQEP